MKRDEDDFIIHEDSENEQVIGNLKGEKTSDFIQRAKGLPVKPLYKLFLKEYIKHTEPTVLAGCSRCDLRVKRITQQNVNSIRLQNLITWTKLEGHEHGIFTYAREHLSLLKCLQSGQNMCRIRMVKLSEKLTNMPASRQFLNYLVATDFENKYTQWFSDIPKQITKNKKIHCIPYLVVFNKNSNSSPLRLVQQANSKFKSLCDGRHCPCAANAGEEVRKEETPARTSSLTSTEVSILTFQGKSDSTQGGLSDEGQSPGSRPRPPGDGNPLSKNGSPLPGSCGGTRSFEDPSSDTSRPDKRECVQRISYNQCIPQYNTALPPLQKLALQTKLAIRTSGADVAKFFRALENCIETQLLNAIYMYKCNISQRPTFNQKDANGTDNKMEILLHKRQLWGLADLPSSSITALGLSFGTYKAWIKSDVKNKINEAKILQQIGIPTHFLLCKQCDDVYNFILQQIKTLIFTKLYVDDVVNFISLKSTLEFLDLQKCKHRTSSGYLPDFESQNHGNQEFNSVDPKSDSYLHGNVKYEAVTIKQGAENFELCLMSLAVLLFRHSNFHLKSFEGLGKNAILINNLIKAVKPEMRTPSDLTQPKLKEIHKEHIKTELNHDKSKKKKLNPPTEQNIVLNENEKYKDNIKENQTTKKQPFLTQLALNYYEDETVGLRARSLKFPISKAKHIEFFSYKDFSEFHSSRNLKSVTRRQISSLLGQCYDSHTGIHIIFPITILKNVVAKTVIEKENWQWEERTNPVLWQGILAAVKILFQNFNEIQPKCNITWQLDSQLFCILMTDASATLRAHNIYMVQTLKIGKTSKNKIQNLSNKCFLGSAKNPSIPQAELLAMESGVDDLCNILEWSKEIGLMCHPNNVLICTDSTTAILQIRMPPAQLKVKIANIVARIIVNLTQYKLNPFLNIYHFAQDKQFFVPDLLSKINLLDSEKQICDHFDKGWNKATNWMEFQPHQWNNFLSRNPPLGSDYELALGKLDTTKNSNKNLILQLIKVKTEMFEPAKFTMQMGYDSLKENKEVQPIYNPIVLNTIADTTNHQTKNNKNTNTNINTNTNTNTNTKTNTITYTIQTFKEQIQRLLERKMSQVGTQKGPIYILTLCLFFGLKLKQKSKQNQKERMRNSDGIGHPKSTV